ncbi:glycoside hydrolase family 16 protein [Streptosporangium subroseum]|uniref:glycoside hydrolase family 16 protein n=1 Tax=Streptosporangium subroseum TaxID=106412 RepID=UPI00308E6997|nr:glycoside hydrolase family 16 protein [Streptosporangium subroseum]
MRRVIHILAVLAVAPATVTFGAVPASAAVTVAADSLPTSPAAPVADRSVVAVAKPRGPGKLAVRALTGVNPLTFGQDFTGPAGAGPNTGLGTPVWFNDPCWKRGCTGTLAEYRLDHAQLDGRGHLVLTADRAVTPGARCGPVACRYASARLTMLDWEGGKGLSSWSQAGGHLEARMRAPLGKGLWPAFWTVGANSAEVVWPASGEIDVMEALGDHSALVEQHAHNGMPDEGFAGSPTPPAERHAHDWVPDIDFGGSTTLPAGQTIAGWHTYAVDWDAGANGYLKWSVDGVVTRTLTAAQAGPAWAQSFRDPHAMILDLAVGGDAWVGEPDAGTVFPARLEVDWVRAYRNPMA